MQIPRILKMLPLPAGENIAPLGPPSHCRLEPTHLLHSIQLIITELDPGVLLHDPTSRAIEIRRSVFIHSFPTLGPSLFLVGDVVRACVAWSQRVAAEIFGFGDYGEFSEAFGGEVEAEEAAGEVQGGGDYAGGVGGPEGYGVGWGGELGIKCEYRVRRRTPVVKEERVPA